MQEPLIHKNLETGEHINLNINPFSDYLDVPTGTQIIQCN
jgi:hypothetical protein